MTAVINALKSGDLHRGLQTVNRELVATTRSITGADAESTKKAAGVFVGTWKALVGRQGNGEPSAPGEPPRKQFGDMQKSIGTAVVDGVRRVGSSDFTARLQEFGVTGGDRPIEPRPHARPALEEAAPKMTDVFVGEVQRRVAR